jgi:hypothetical protein
VYPSRGSASLPHQALLTPAHLPAQLGHWLLSPLDASSLPLCVGTHVLSFFQLSLHPGLRELQGAWACGVAVQSHHGL